MPAAIPIALGVSAAATVGSTIYSADQSRKAANQAKDASKALLADLKYEPIDIEKLKASTTEQSIANAKASIALEQELAPSIAAMRTELPRQIQNELTMGGRLSPDVANQVAQQARTIGGGSGTFSGVGPITAALTGSTAQGLIDQRQQKAASMLAANQLPTVGLDAGALASLEAQNAAALNQYNLAKAGVSQNMINSQYQADMARTGAVAGGIQGLGSLVGMMGMMGMMGATKTPTVTNAGGAGTYPLATGPSFASTLPTNTWLSSTPSTFRW